MRNQLKDWLPSDNLFSQAQRFMKSLETGSSTHSLGIYSLALLQTFEDTTLTPYCRTAEYGFEHLLTQLGDNEMRNRIIQRSSVYILDLHRDKPQRVSLATPASIFFKSTPRYDKKVGLPTGLCFIDGLPPIITSPLIHPRENREYSQLNDVSPEILNNDEVSVLLIREAHPSILNEKVLRSLRQVITITT